MITLYLFSVLFICLLLGMPIAVALGFSSATTILLFTDDSIASIAQQFYNGASEHETLLAIPFFILSTAFLTRGGVAIRIIHFANNCLGHIKGGLAIASVLACMIFTAISGSSRATVAAIGTIAIAKMIKTGYPEKLAVGMITTSGTLGILIPPSIVMIVYATATEQSTSALFAAGLTPGLLMGVIFMLIIYIIARIKDFPAVKFPGIIPLLKNLFKASGGLILIVNMLGSISGGITSPTEAAAISSVYAFILAVAGYRDIGPLKGVAFRYPQEKLFHALLRGICQSLLAIPRSFYNDDVYQTILGAVRTGLILLFIIANAELFAYVLTSEQIPQNIAQSFIDMNLSPWIFLILMNVFLLIVGAFMEPSAIMLIMAPILLPITLKLGVDPIHLGIIMVVNMQLSLLTPPVGMNLFVASSIVKKNIDWVLKSVLLWFVLLLGFLILITHVPKITMWFPDYLQNQKFNNQ